MHAASTAERPNETSAFPPFWGGAVYGLSIAAMLAIGLVPLRDANFVPPAAAAAGAEVASGSVAADTWDVFGWSLTPPAAVIDAGGAVDVTYRSRLGDANGSVTVSIGPLHPYGPTAADVIETWARNIGSGDRGDLIRRAAAEDEDGPYGLLEESGGGFRRLRFVRIDGTRLVEGEARASEDDWPAVGALLEESVRSLRPAEGPRPRRDTGSGPATEPIRPSSWDGFGWRFDPPPTLVGRHFDAATVKISFRRDDTHGIVSLKVAPLDPRRPSLDEVFEHRLQYLRNQAPRTTIIRSSRGTDDAGPFAVCEYVDEKFHGFTMLRIADGRYAEASAVAPPGRRDVLVPLLRESILTLRPSPPL